MLPVYIGAGVSVALLIVLFVLRFTKKSSKKASSRDTEIVNDINNAKDKENNNDSQNVYEKDDVLVPAKVQMNVGKKGQILPGKYTILSTDENRLDLNIKVGGYIRFYSHGSEIILEEGDTIMPIGVGIILK